MNGRPIDGDNPLPTEDELQRWVDAQDSRLPSGDGHAPEAEHKAAPTPDQPQAGAGGGGGGGGDHDSDSEGKEHKAPRDEKSGKSRRSAGKGDASDDSDSDKGASSHRHHRSRRQFIKHPWSYKSFSDTSGGFESFWEHTNSMFQLEDVPRADQYQILILLMSPHFTWVVRDLDKSKVNNIDKLVEYLRSRLTPHAKMLSHRLSLSRCKMRDGETVAQFATHLKALGFSAHPRDPQLRASACLNAFLTGLRPALIAGLGPSIVSLKQGDDNQSFADLTILAESVEGLHKSFLPREEGGDISRDSGRSDRPRVINAIEASPPQDNHPTDEQARDEGAPPFPMNERPSQPDLRNQPRTNHWSNAPPNEGQGFNRGPPRGGGGYRGRGYGGQRPNPNFIPLNDRSPPSQYQQQQRGPMLLRQPLMGYSAADCRNGRGPGNGQGRRHALCYRCQSDQHLIRDCPHPPPQETGIQRSANRVTASSRTAGGRGGRMTLPPFYY